ncbi:MAG TPA: hypothetical protein VN884_07800 [Candidatus Sulfotelmatobacter sp.]|jgi:hypothetical protein|nr:hypothetical protein [Candidatus Sulfotelmatobacter sp.]
MDLKELVEKYLAAAGGSFGKAVPIAALGLSREETERVFDFLDEDYHISRFFHFQNAASAGASFQINGFPQTHISIDAEIRDIL